MKSPKKLLTSIKVTLGKIQLSEAIASIRAGLLLFRFGREEHSKAMCERMSINRPLACSMLIWPPFIIHTQKAETDDGNLFGVNKFASTLNCNAMKFIGKLFLFLHQAEAKVGKLAYHLCKD